MSTPKDPTVTQVFTPAKASEIGEGRAPRVDVTDADAMFDLALQLSKASVRRLGQVSCDELRALALHHVVAASIASRAIALVDAYDAHEPHAMQLQDFAAFIRQLRRAA